MPTPAETRLKTLVKYAVRGKLLSARFGRESYLRTPEQLIAVGAGDCTVQEDGLTVHVARAHLARLKAPISA